MKTHTSIVVERPASMDFVRSKLHVFGSEEVRQFFDIDPRDVPPMPFSELDVLRALRMRQYLMLRLPRTIAGLSLSMRCMRDILENNLVGQRLLAESAKWCEEETFFALEAPRAGWFLVSLDAISASVGRSYVGQYSAMTNYVSVMYEQDEDFLGRYEEAIEEFRGQEVDLKFLAKTDSGNCLDQCQSLRFNKHRLSAVEVLHDTIVANSIEPMRSSGEWTKSVSASHLSVTMARVPGIEGIQLWKNSVKNPVCGFGTRFQIGCT